jgi:WD40 repeat protein
VYASALLFAPKRSVVRRLFALEFLPQWISQQPDVPDDWSELLQAFDVQGGFTSAIAFSPDGQLLARAGTAGLGFWDPSSGQFCASLGDDGDFFSSSLQFSPDGRVLLHRCNYRHRDTELAFLIDVKLMAKRGVIDCGLTYGSRASFSADGELLALGNGHTVTLWDVMSVTLRQTLIARASHGCVVFSPRRHILAYTIDHSVVLYDCSADWDVARLRGQGEGVSDVAFSPDGERLAIGALDGNIQLWDVARATVHFTTNVGPHRVLRTVFVGDGQLLVVVDEWSCSVWDVPTGSKRYVIDKEMRNGGHTFSPDGQLLLSELRGNSGAAGVWDIQQNKLLGKFAGHYDGLYHAAAFSPDGRLLASAADKEPLVVRDVGLMAAQEPSAAYVSRVARFDVAPGGQHVACATYHGKIFLWHVATGVRERAPEHYRRFELSGLCFSPDGRLLAFVTAFHDIMVWDFGAGRTHSLLHLGVRVRERGLMLFAPDSARLVLQLENSDIALWDFQAAEGNISTLFRTSWDPVEYPAFAPDGSHLAGWTRDAVCVWDVRHAKAVSSYRSARCKMAFVPPQGSLLAVIGWASPDEGRLELWDWRAGTVVRWLKLAI